MEITNLYLLDLDGNRISERSNDPSVEPIPMTIAGALRYVAMQGPPQGAPPFTADHSVERLIFALDCYQCPPDGVISISSKLAKILREEVPRYFAPLVAAQVVLELDGHAPVIEDRNNEIKPQSSCSERGQSYGADSDHFE